MEDVALRLLQRGAAVEAAELVSISRATLVSGHVASQAPPPPPESGARLVRRDAARRGAGPQPAAGARSPPRVAGAPRRHSRAGGAGPRRRAVEVGSWPGPG